MKGIGIDEKSNYPAILNISILMPAKAALRRGEAIQSRRLFGVSDPHERERTVQGRA